MVLYVLHGYWNTPDFDGADIIDNAPSAAPLIHRLEKIAESRGVPFCTLPGEVTISQQTDTCLELSSSVEGAYAKFYVQRIHVG